MTDSPITDFESVATSLNIFINAISNLPIDFRTICSDQNIIMFLEQILYRDKNKRFNDTLRFINDGKVRSWEAWKKDFGTLLSAHLMTIANSNQHITSSTNKLNQSKNETDKIDINANITPGRYI